ncbi:MAG: cobalamin biosynthesis protein [Spirochaetaceae bacterium]|jgi:cobalt-precorrin 5A hydrolase|nr:cobalamin biosynthesis protein [Spirochaetaceae bacterium]
MTVTVFAFTGAGKALKGRLTDMLVRRGHRILEPGGTLAEQAAAAFHAGDALIFIGAAGIAVRTVAPLLRSKERDPAVVVIDEKAAWVIALLSGHLGGANALTRELAALLHSTPVITTATDINQVFAVDLWAQANGLVIDSMEKAKQVSARLLAGEEIALKSDFPVTGPVPKGLKITPDPEAPFGIAVSIYRNPPGWLRLIPPCVYLGIGCRRGIPEEDIRSALESALDLRGIDITSVTAVGTIAAKKDEPGLRSLCEKRGWRFFAYTPEELTGVPGHFTASEFVRSIAGVDNVCERAAVLASGGGRLVFKKFSRGGVTAAGAEGKFFLRFGDGEAGE